jgi:sugar/nucleoside kinase (ribokinase family)
MAGSKTASAICYIRDVDREYLIEPADITETPVDTTGAGDAFAAGFLYGFLNNKELEECGHLGNIVAQFSITKIGARQGLPTLIQLAQRYKELYNSQL